MRTAAPTKAHRSKPRSPGAALPAVQHPPMSASRLGPGTHQLARSPPASGLTADLSATIDAVVKQTISDGCLHPAKALSVVAGGLFAKLSQEQVRTAGKNRRVQPAPAPRCRPAPRPTPWVHLMGTCGRPRTGHRPGQCCGAANRRRRAAVSRHARARATLKRAQLQDRRRRPGDRRAAPAAAHAIGRLPPPPRPLQFLAVWDSCASHPDTPVLRLLLNTLTAAAEAAQQQQQQPVAGAPQALAAAAAAAKAAGARRPRPRSSGQQQQQQDPAVAAAEEEASLPLQPSKRQRANAGAGANAASDQAGRQPGGGKARLSDRFHADRALRDQQP